MEEKFVLGFVFNTTMNKVLLIQKNSPDHQKGKWDGMGGRILPNEEPENAISRELQEGCDLIINPQYWSPVTQLRPLDKTWRVHVYMTVSPIIDNYKTKTDEQVFLFDINDLPVNLVNSVNWLIPMSLDPKIYGSFTQVIFS